MLNSLWIRVEDRLHLFGLGFHTLSVICVRADLGECKVRVDLGECKVHRASSLLICSAAGVPLGISYDLVMIQANSNPDQAPNPTSSWVSFSISYDLGKVRVSAKVGVRVRGRSWDRVDVKIGLGSPSMRRPHE